MKTYLFQTAFWLATLCAMPVKLTAQVKHTVTFQRDSIQVREKQYEDGNPYTTLEYPDYYTDAEEGAPALPYRCLQFIIPDEATGYTVEVAAAQEAEFTITTPLLPGQKPVSLSIYSTKPAFVPPDPALYSSSSRYPAKIAEIVNDGYFDGDKRIVTVRVFPMQYVAAENKIILNKNFTFTICPDRSRTAALHKIAPVHAAAAKSEEELKQELNFVENKQDIPLYAVQANNAGLRILPPYPSLPAYEYTIIAPQAFYSALERLVSWKRMKGMTAGVVTLESIINDPAIKGDEVSGIYDDAGKIRHYLTSAYQRGTKYVFLVGKDIPFRYGTGNYDWWGADEKEYKIPTDLYFSDLNANWNVDKDQYYGEFKGDAMDYFPELYIGRISCKNITELNNYLNKLFCYEKSPGNGNSGYVRNALFTQSDIMQANDFAHKIAEPMFNNFTSIRLFEELPSYNSTSPTFPKGSDIIQELNTHYGFVYFSNHGWDFGIKTLTSGNNNGGLSGIAYCDAYDEDPDNWISGKICETGNGIDCLTNIGYPFVVYSNSCTTMPYDKLSDIPYNFGEAFTIAGKYGAVAYLGSTRSQYVYHVKDTVFANKLKINYNRLGVAEALSKISVTRYEAHFNVLAHNLIGCPETQLWPSIPRELSSTEIKILYGPESIILNTIDSPSNFSIVGLFNEDTYVQSVFNKKTAIFGHLPKNYIMTIRKDDCLPYIAPLYLQNENISGNYKIFDVRNVIIGNQVDNKKASGNFVLKKGAQLYIEYTGETILEAGFEVEIGATFELNPTDH